MRHALFALLLAGCAAPVADRTLPEAADDAPEAPVGPAVDAQEAPRPEAPELPEEPADDEPIAVDADGDGFVAEEDCDDADADVHPGAVEHCHSGVDEDCDPATDCSALCIKSFDYGRCDAPLTDLASPVLHWDYEQPTAQAIHGVGADGVVGTFVGQPDFAEGVLGQAVDLDGSSWILSDAPVPLPGDDFTLVTWVRLAPEANGGPFHFVLSNGNGLPAWTGASLFVRGLQPIGLMEQGGGAYETFPEGNRTCAGRWAQVALTFDGTDMVVHTDDGQQVTSRADFTNVPWGQQPFGVGNDPNNTTRPLEGLVDETMAFDVALSAAELDELRAEQVCAR